MEAKKLKAILESHRKWLNDEEGGKRADLRGTILRDANLRDASLREADLRDADLRKASLREADLRDADLRKADLRKADLRDADLRDADLRDADLKGTDLDFSCWPLWCGGLNVKVDKRIAVQLLYHFCSLVCDDEEIKAAQKSLYPLANQIHRDDVPQLK